MSSTAEAVRAPRANKYNPKAAVTIAVALNGGLANGGKEESGAEFARTFLSELRKHPTGPDSVILHGFIDDAMRLFSQEEQEAFADVLQQELVRGLAPDESGHSPRLNPLLNRGGDHGDTAQNIADASEFMSVAAAAIDGAFTLDEEAQNGRCRLMGCITHAARALANDLQKEG